MYKIGDCITVLVSSRKNIARFRTYMCFDTSDKFAYFSPVKKQENGKVVLDINKDVKVTCINQKLFSSITELELQIDEEGC